MNKPLSVFARTWARKQVHYFMDFKAINTLQVPIYCLDAGSTFTAMESP